jgi:putative transposase
MSATWATYCADHGIVCSMSDVGSCDDNAVAEGFFGLLKRERVSRRHSHTNGLPPADFARVMGGVP